MKNNPRITAKDRGLIKGAIRRAFARSDLHKQAKALARVEHYDPNRPRVKKWSKCKGCGRLVPEYTTVVDHILPIIDVASSFEDQSLDETVNRTWCDISLLQVLCDEPCHKKKTDFEKEQRKKNKKAKKDLQSKKK